MQLLRHGIHTGNAVQSVIIGSTLTAVFDAQRTGGNTGCFTFGGPYTTDGDRITIESPGVRASACSDRALEAQAEQYLAALQLTKTYRVTGSRLDLFREGDTMAATFEKTK